ncbi:hypothetical protein Leryth_018235 [Lithospermum erythrorhizon]|nr:hypothetical protein Leryth_018235 [Lithospermum erythrorhizon]
MVVDEIGGQENRLTKRTIRRNLKTKIFKKGNKSEENDETCAICLKDFEEDENIGILSCQHQFHRDCLTNWLINKNSCPMCRATAIVLINNQIR